MNTFVVVNTIVAGSIGVAWTIYGFQRRKIRWVIEGIALLIITASVFVIWGCPGI